MTLSTRLDSLLLYDPSYARTTVNVWVAQPATSEEAALGQIFIVSLIDSADPINHDVINVLQEETKKQYYHNAAWTVERSLEYTLEQVNQRLNHLMTEGVNQWLDHAHILIGALHHQQLVLAPAGGVHAYLLRGSRIHDIIGQADQGKIQPLRIFSQVIVGRLDDGDRLLFCTPSLLDFFSLEKLRRTIREYSPTEAVRVLEGTLLGADPENAFAALIVDLESVVEKTAADPLPVGWVSGSRGGAPQASMEQLITREQQTEKLLAPSMWPTIREMSANGRQRFNQFFATTILRRPVRRIVPRAVGSAGPGSGQSNWWSAVKRTWRSMTSKIHYAFFQRRQSMDSPVARTIQRQSYSQAGFFDRVVLWFQRLSRKQQTLLAASLALLLILSLTIVQTGGATRHSSTTDQNVAAIADHLSKAEAAILYGGEATANEQLLAAETLIQQLPNRRAADKAQRQELTDRLQQITSRISRQTVIADPAVLVNLTAGLPAFKPQQLYLLKNQLVAFDPVGNTATVVSQTTAGTPVVIPATVDIGQPKTGAVDGVNTVLFVTDRLSFAELDTVKKTWKPIDAAFPVTNPAIQFLSVYQNRVYALDRSHQQLYRFAKGSASLGLGQAWLKEPATLSAARAVVVDGNIFVLQPGGRLEQYANGRLVTDFRLMTIRPALTEAIRLWTDTASANLYVVDPSRQRIVVFDKHGQLVDQYSSPAWTNLRDVVANEKTKSAYVLSGTTIYRIDLLH